MRRVAHACAQLDAPVGDVVKDREVLREPQRVTKREKADVGGETDAFRAGRSRTRDRHEIREVTVVEEVVLGEPAEF